MTQKQFKSALERVGKDHRRNASGIKTVNSRVGKLDGRVNDVVSVNVTQSKRIRALDKQMRMDGALELASAWNPTSGAIDLLPLLRGAIKSGVLGDPKGALANPLVVGGLGVLLREDSNGSSILSNILNTQNA